MWSCVLINIMEKEIVKEKRRTEKSSTVLTSSQVDKQSLWKVFKIFLNICRKDF